VGTWIETARVVRRAGFGASGRDVDALTGGDVAGWIGAGLAGDPDADLGAVPVPQFEPLPRLPRNASMADRKQADTRRNTQNAQLVAWWVKRMVSVRNPVREKLTLVWHNHFAASLAKVGSAPEMAAQNQTLRRMGPGDFRELAYAMLTDAAMLRWLDGQTNTAKAPNENLSREFMELFALGHGNGYTEDDVRAGARALAGWTIAPDGSTRQDPKRCDTGVKTVLGVTGPLDAAGFCDAVLAQPAGPRYMAGRMWQQLVSDRPASSAALDRLTGAWKGRDTTALMQAIFADPEFASAQGSFAIGPVEWLVGAARTLHAPTDDKTVTWMVGVLRSLGQQPFYPPNVGGWPSGQAWLSTAAARTRLAAAERLAAHVDLGAIESTAAGSRLDAVAHLLGIGGWSDRTAAVLRPLAGKLPRLVALALNTPEYLVH
jgi:uncharacterized protein (DUF1800 family)